MYTSEILETENDSRDYLRNLCQIVLRTTYVRRGICRSSPIQRQPTQQVSYLYPTGVGEVTVTGIRVWLLTMGKNMWAHGD